MYGRSNGLDTRRFFAGKTKVPGQDAGGTFTESPYYGAAGEEPRPTTGEPTLAPGPAPAPGPVPTQEHIPVPGPIPGSYPVAGEQTTAEDSLLHRLVLRYLADAGYSLTNKSQGEEPKLAQKPCVGGDPGVRLRNQLHTENQGIGGESTRLSCGAVGGEAGSTLAQESVPTRMPGLTHEPAPAQEPNPTPRPVPTREPVPGSYLAGDERTAAKKPPFWTEWGNFVHSSPRGSVHAPTNQPQGEEPNPAPNPGRVDDSVPRVLPQLPTEKVGAPNPSTEDKPTDLPNSTAGMKPKPVATPRPAPTPGPSQVLRPALGLKPLPVRRPTPVPRPMPMPGSTPTRQSPPMPGTVPLQRPTPTRGPISTNQSKPSSKTDSSIHGESKGQSAPGRTGTPTQRFSAKGPQVLLMITGGVAPMIHGAGWLTGNFTSLGY